MNERFRTAWQRHRALVRAWLTLFGAIGAFLVLQPVLIAFGIVHWANQITAQLLAFTLSLIGTPSSAQGTLVRSEIFSLEIIFECTAILPIVLFLAAVAATPSPKRAKLWALLWGLPAIVLFNLVRLVSLVYIGHLAPKYFEMAHVFVWQPLTILFALALWLAWVERQRANLL